MMKVASRVASGAALVAGAISAISLALHGSRFGAVNTMNDLESALAAAKRTLSALLERAAQGVAIADFSALRAASEACLVAERNLGIARGEETAVALEWLPRWSTGAAMPHVVANSHRTIVIYLAETPDPRWDGSYATMKDPSQTGDENLALVQFDRTVAHRIGSPNDEVIQGHPLHGRGLQAYAAHRIVNSKWIAELQAINSVHAGYRSETWATLIHYLLFFHDETFECIAPVHKIEPFRGSFRSALALACLRLLT